LTSDLKKGDIAMDVMLKYVNGHVEVFDNRGRFLFSADTETEARNELEEHFSEYRSNQ